MAVLILLVTIVFGMLVPLGPGIVKADPGSAVPGESFEMTIWGYNTSFSEHVGELRVILKTEEDLCLLAEKVTIKSDYLVVAEFNLPSSLPGGPGVKRLTLIIDQDEHGPAILPDALYIQNSDQYTDNLQWTSLQKLNIKRANRFHFPYRNILIESIRNTYFHVALWFAMLIIFLVSMIYSISYLRHSKPKSDAKAVAFAEVGTLYGLLGITTGMIWAANTWGSPWNWDIKQTMAAVVMLIYFAYFVLRTAVEDTDKKYRTSAAYNIFAFATLIPLLYIIPRMVDSLHPGSGGNPALGGEDLDNTMRIIFYPAIIGWTLLGVWIAQLSGRRILLRRKITEKLLN